jgi:fumarate hydratase class I
VLKLRDGIVVLYKKVATSMPPDVEAALKEAYGREQEGSNSREALSVILENIRLSRDTARPICQDTGVPVFYVQVPRGLSQKDIEETIMDATRVATERVPLRPNAVDIITERNSGDNTGIGFPVIYFRESRDSTLRVDLTLKGSGCENQGQTFKLPVEDLGAERDLEGVRKCVLDTVWKAQGKGCPPYSLGVGIGAAKDQVARLAKEQLMRKIPDSSPHEVIAALEERLLKEINELGIGPLGLGGASTAIGVKVGVNHRHVASYFVDISVCCWANRRGTLIW